MRLDHIAYRVKDRYKTAQFFIDCLGYRIPHHLPEGFKIQFNDGTEADCLVLVPSEQICDSLPWSHLVGDVDIEYHLAPEIFISDGVDGSIVGEWVKKRDGVGGIHHIAYQVNDVAAKMAEWKERGYAEFLSDEPLICPGLEQVFTKPSQLTGIIYELIKRTDYGFCKENVKNLMLSSKDIK